MRLTAIAVLAVLALAAAAAAGQNPHIRAYVTMDPDDYVPSAPDAVGGSIVTTYLCFDCLGFPIPNGGLTGVSLTLDYQCGGFVAGSADLSSFHPSAETVSGGPDDTVNGWVIAAPECVYPNEAGIICVARIPWFYIGPPGDILILPSPFDGKATVDCSNDTDYFCVYWNGAIGQEVQTPGDFDCDCSYYPFTEAICEPQGGEYPNHPPTYWYVASPGYMVYWNGFHVQVFDPDIGNYTNWVDPDGWTHADTIAIYDGSYWVSWYDTLCAGYPESGYETFQFDNWNIPSWGHWTMTVGCGGDDLDPFEGMTHSSWDFPDRPDGYGYRVHVPTAGSPVERTSWGTIKAMYR